MQSPSWRIRWGILAIGVVAVVADPGVVWSQPAFTPRKSARPSTRLPSTGGTKTPRFDGTPRIDGTPRGDGVPRSDGVPRTGGVTRADGSPLTNPAVRGPKTEIIVELLTGTEGVGYSAQRWLQLFERLQIEFKVRRAEVREDLETIEEAGVGARGATRRVRVRGRLEKSGQLTFSDRTFTEDQAGKLAKWLRELQEFGAQGSPQGQPVWGLGKAQFQALFKSLSEPVTETTAEKSLTEAIDALALPVEFPLSFSAGAKQFQPARRGEIPAGLDDPSARRLVQQSVTGMSKGTALAVVLSEFGLGFRPRRMADGSIDLQICTQAEIQDLWPVGWPQQASNPKTAPKYYALTKFDLHDVMLDETLSTAATFVDMPILVDRPALEGKKIDLSAVKVSFGPRQATWSLALQQLTFQAKAQTHLYIDEAGRPFIWVTPLGVTRKIRAMGTE